MGPLTYLAKKSNNYISITVANPSLGVAWPDILQYDLVFCHRPCRGDDLTILKIAHNCGVPVWVDYDDWLFDIPGWNPNAGYYNDMGVQNIMAHCIASADLVSCTTFELYNKFKQVNPNTVIIPNAYRSDLFPYRAKTLEPRQPISYWRGTNTHDADLLSVRDGFQQLNGKTIFMGGSSWLLLSGMPKDSYHIMNSRDLFAFNRSIYDMRPKVMVFPLVDCFFNRCKSNIAYIEAMHAGALCVAPDMPEWKREGVITYIPHDSNSFRDAVNHALEFLEQDHQTVLNAAFQTMKETLDITNVNKIREYMVADLTSHDFHKNSVSPFDQRVAIHALTILKGKKNEATQETGPTELS